MHDAAVSPPAPPPAAYAAEEFAEQPQGFAAGQGQQHGVATVYKAIATAHSAVDRTDKRRAAIDAIGAELVVMASPTEATDDAG